MNTLLSKEKAIAIDPSYIPDSNHKTPWIGHFWFSCAEEYKRGLEIMGTAFIDNHESMTVGSIQIPDGKTLRGKEKTLAYWYRDHFTKRKYQLQNISN